MLQNMLTRARQARQDQGGFTLIELLIVITVLGVLAGIVVFGVADLPTGRRGHGGRDQLQDRRGRCGGVQRQEGQLPGGPSAISSRPSTSRPRLHLCPTPRRSTPLAPPTGRLIAT